MSLMSVEQTQTLSLGDELQPQDIQLDAFASQGEEFEDNIKEEEESKVKVEDFECKAEEEETKVKIEEELECKDEEEETKAEIEEFNMNDGAEETKIEMVELECKDEEAEVKIKMEDVECKDEEFLELKDEPSVKEEETGSVMVSVKDEVGSVVASVKVESVPLELDGQEEWIDPSTINWSALTERQAEKMKKKLRRQEKRKRRAERHGDEPDGKRSKKDRKQKKDKEGKHGKRTVKVEEGAVKVEEAAVPLGEDLPTAEGTTENEARFDPFNSGLPPQENFRKILSTLKVPRAAGIAVPLQQELSNRLIEKMYDAYRRDQVAAENGEPGVMKLRLLGEVKAAMLKSYLHEHLVHRYDRGMSILDCFADWLEPVRVAGQDKRQLPNLNIRTAILESLAKLPLQNDLAKVQKRDDSAWEGVCKEDLEQTKIGHRVSWLAKHPLETVENRRLAEHIIERWSRLLFNNTRDYKKLGEADAVRGPAHAHLADLEWKDPLKNLPPEMVHSKDPDAELEARKERFKRRIRLPQRQMMNFHYRPKSQLTPEDLERREKTQSAKERLQQMVVRHAKDLKTANKIGGRLRNMSIEGSLSTLPQGNA